MIREEVGLLPDALSQDAAHPSSKFLLVEMKYRVHTAQRRLERGTSSADGLPEEASPATPPTGLQPKPGSTAHCLTVPCKEAIRWLAQVTVPTHFLPKRDGFDPLG
jgi:hypothetical protein